ncbi:MAG: tripartite tricarboxylate transporter substrate-binding protein [Armatimonadota bacterium]|nr:tripartite tricarboxylate transporter substrate-binding protein [Armatimonadota bacterium]
MNSVKELVALAKARPNQLNFGSSGTGVMPHLVGEMLKLVAGIQMLHEPVPRSDFSGEGSTARPPPRSMVSAAA